MALRSSLEVSLWKLASSVERLRRGREILAALAGSAPGHGLPAPRLCAATITSVPAPAIEDAPPPSLLGAGEVDGSGRAGPAIGGGRERGRRGGAGMVARGRVGAAEQGRRQE
ncbi:hypothetical protein U9M48_020704 [Paspalum notatum var. saurae]|uniref:Uncharacterized protein n=1 Tax=Paspalum notatum var. saurae TaxID=547442 RepID=A0AAQ3WSX9_PASNO